jgi:putative hydrolase of the HAD superfamily
LARTQIRIPGNFGLISSRDENPMISLVHFPTDALTDATLSGDRFAGYGNRCEQPPKMIDTIGIDADDTLWHNEVIFEATHARFCELLSRYHDAGTVEQTLHDTELRNLELFGYGIKGYALSSIETAITLTNGEIHAEEIQAILDSAKAMMLHPVELLDGVKATLASLADSYVLILITKGDLRDQQRKITESGLAEYFAHTEVVAEKDRDNYARILERYRVRPGSFAMVGNSIKSDILPVIDLGGTGIHIPYITTWEHEKAMVPKQNERFHKIDAISELPALIARLQAYP